MPSSSHATDGTRYNNRKGWEQKQQSKTKFEEKNKAKYIRTKMYIYTPVVYKYKWRAISDGLQQVDGEGMESEWQRRGQNNSLERSNSDFQPAPTRVEHRQQF